MFLGLRTVICPTADLTASKAWYSSVLGIEPYFDEPFYVGYNVNGYELGLLPDADPALGAITVVTMGGGAAGAGTGMTWP
jgi:catechol 2,3-dioxygenase-like lactoylglutathione lyase family enzyme